MQRFQNILCAVTPGPAGDDAIARAVTLTENHQARLTLMEVIDGIPSEAKLLDRALWPPDLRQRILTEHHRRLTERVTPFRKKEVPLTLRVLTGIPFLEIIREVLRNRHDLVIKAAESGGLLDRAFGSDDMHLLRKCPCPVWLVKPGAPKNYRCIVAAVDVNDTGSPRELRTRHQLNVRVLEMAASLALSEFTELHIAYAWEDFSEPVMQYPFMNIPREKILRHAEESRLRQAQNLRRLVHETLDKAGKQTREYLAPQVHLLKGSPRREIPDFAAAVGADLVVMGTVARTGIPGLFMGNTAETILNRLDCSILAVKPPGFVTPVTLENPTDEGP